MSLPDVHPGILTTSWGGLISADTRKLLAAWARLPFPGVLFYFYRLGAYQKELSTATARLECRSAIHLSNHIKEGGSHQFSAQHPRYHARQRISKLLNSSTRRSDERCSCLPNLVQDRSNRSTILLSCGIATASDRLL